MNKQHSEGMEEEKTVNKQRGETGRMMGERGRTDKSHQTSRQNSFVQLLSTLLHPLAELGEWADRWINEKMDG